MSSRSQSIHLPLGITNASFGTYNSDFANVFAFCNNQAVLGSSRKFAIGLEATRKFLLPELDQMALALMFPVMGGALGVEVIHFGFEDYNETRLGIAYGKHLGRIVDLGVGFDYHSFYVSGYGSEMLGNLEASILLHPAEKIIAGIQVFNPTGSSMGKNNKEKLAFSYRFGLGYRASSEVSTIFEILKTEQRPVNIRAGLEYVFAKQFFATLGIETAWMQPYGSVALHWENFRVGLTGSYHMQLGFTPSLLIAFGNSSIDKAK